MNSKCDNLRNPFIKDSSNEIYSISDKIIEDIRQLYINTGQNENEKKNKLEKLKIFKKNVLPKIMGTFKNKFLAFNSANSHAMELLVLSNSFKQFDDFYLNPDYFPYLNGINQLIENKNSLIESDEQGAIDNLYKEIENAETIYFKNNKIYKENILKFIATLASKYFGEFRTYADFETTKSIVELNSLKSYNTYLRKNVITSLNSGKNSSEVQKDINKTFNSIINVFPSSDYEYFPRELDDIVTEYKSNNSGKITYIINEENEKMKKVTEKISSLNTNIETYSKTVSTGISNEEEKYKEIINKFSRIIKLEQKEEVLFIDLQSTRNQLNAKIKEIGKGVQDKKYSLLQSEYNSAYINYTKLVYEKIKLYKELESIIPKSSPNSQSQQNSSINNPILNILNDKFQLIYIFKQIFEKGLGKNNETGKNITNENSEKHNILEEKCRKNVYNYLYKENNKGIDDINLESYRNQDKRNIYEFTLYMNDIFEQHVNFFQNRIDYYNSLKQKVETELSIIKSMEESAKTQLQEKQSYLTSLTADIKDFEKKKSDLISNMDKKKTNIDKELSSSIITSTFGTTTLDTLSKKEYNKEENVKEAYIVKVHNKPSFDAIINTIIKNINDLKEDDKKKYSDLINHINDIFKYKKISTTSSSFTLNDVDNFNMSIKTNLNKILIIKQNGQTQYTNNENNIVFNYIKKLCIDFINQKKDEYYEIYKKDINEFVLNDSVYKKGYDALTAIMSGYKSYEDDVRKLREYDEKIYTLKGEEKEIKEGPEEFTKQYNAKNTFNKRIDEYLKQLNKILDSKKKSNEELQKLIGTEAFKNSMELMYNALISRYKSVYSLIKRDNIRSEVYNLFSNDFLYKITKTLHDLISPAIQLNQQIPPESLVQVAKSYQTYVNERLEDFPKMVEKDDGIMKFKRYQLRTMTDVLKGQKIGSYYVKPNSNMKKFVEKIKNENINDISGLVKKLYNKDLSINQINKEKLGKYMRNYANIEKSLRVNGGDPTSVSVTSGNKKNKINQIINMPKEGIEKYFMKNIYKILLADGTNTSKDFVEKLNKLEYKMLMAAKAKLRTFTYLYKDGTSGTNKIANHFKLLYNMTKICLDDFDKKLTEILKRGKATAKLINLLMIAKYIYMEVIMIYALSYFC